MTGNTVDPSPHHGRREFLGIQFARLTLDQVLKWCRAQAASPDFAYIVTPNVDHVVQLETAVAAPWHTPLAQAYASAALKLCDSRVLAALARMSGITLTVVPGSDLTAALLDRGLQPGDRVAIVGGNDGQLAVLEQRYPAIEFHQHIPPMGVRTDLAAQDAVVTFLENAGCDFVLFAIGFPQSEIVAHRLQQRGLARGVGLCIGASIEFLTGEKQRAPMWMQRLGLEWAFRLASEPQRLARRYLVEGPRIVGIWRKWSRSV